MLEAITHRDVWMQESILPLHNIYVAIRETIMDRARIDIWEDVQRYDDDKGYRQVPNIHIHLPEDLSLVSTTDLAAHNAEMQAMREKVAELEADNTKLAEAILSLNRECNAYAAELANTQPVQTTDYAPVYSWDEPDPAYGKRIGAISNGRLYIETADDTVSIGLPQGMALMKVREP